MLAIAPACDVSATGGELNQPNDKQQRKQTTHGFHTFPLGHGLSARASKIGLPILAELSHHRCDPYFLSSTGTRSLDSFRTIVTFHRLSPTPPGLEIQGQNRKNRCLAIDRVFKRGYSTTAFSCP